MKCFPSCSEGFPDGSNGKEFTCSCRRPGFNPWVRKIPLGKTKATHSDILAWRIPWTEEPGRLQSKSCRVGHDWVTNIHTWGSLALIQKLQGYTWLRNRYSYKFWDSFLAVFHYSILSSLKHRTINISKKNKRLKCASLVHRKTMISCFYSLLQRYL